MTLNEKRIQCIIQALKNLGGAAHYSILYDEIRTCEEYGFKNFANEKNFQASVRRLIQEHSSDTSIYSEENKDLFYSVEGLGSGIWGLRDFELSSDEKNDTDDYLEGKRRLREHITIERNSKLVQEAKKHFLREHGKLYCEICGFNFEHKYGNLGNDFIEAHHKIPLSKAGKRTSKIEDLLMVCSNCHRMIHQSQ